MTPALAVRAATVRLGGAAVVSAVSLDVEPGTVVGVVGPNGAGKTTLLDAVSGFVPLASGSVEVMGADVTGLTPHRRARLGVGRTFQGLDLFDDLTVEENLQVVADACSTASGPTALAVEPPAPDDRLPGSLSHDQRKEVALARTLAGHPRLLLLDEPAAGLDAPARQALAVRLRALAASGLAVLVADHDLDLVLSVCDRVSVLDLGRVIASGPPAEVRSHPALAAAYLGRDGALEPTGRRPAEPGARLLEARGLTCGYGGGAAVSGLDLEVRAGEVVALLGPNGSGKTTVLRALSGLLPLAAGHATVLGLPVDGRVHRLVRRGLAHVPQDRAVLAGLTVGENLRLAARGTRRSRPAAVETALDRFPALVPLRHRPAGRLSGGEQQILALARAVAARPRLLLVDELSLGLAPRAVAQAARMVREVADEGAGALLVEQHPALALQVADRAVVLARGEVTFAGPATELAAHPEVLEHAYLGRPLGGGS